MKLGNSYKNRKISAVAQKIKVRDKYQVIELIKDVVNARIKALEKERGKTYEKIMEDEVRLIEEEMKKTKLSDEDIAQALIEAVEEVEKSN